MTGWLLAALALLVGIGACLYACFARRPGDGLIALELAGTLGTTALLVLAEAFRRQPFGDLAVVCGLLSVIGALAYARFIERGV
jgi:multisubunit Na+/H+ antiporter MnhF subunit